MAACPTVPRQDEPAFLVICRDAPGQSGLRETHLKGHLDHVEANWERYVVAGPIREPGETALVGSVFLVLAASEDDARALMAGDPYVSSGLYGEMEVKQMTLSIGRYPGGKIWESAEAIAHLARGG